MSFSLFRRFALVSQSLLRGVPFLEGIERRILSRLPERKVIPIFIIGPPRSGSTLLSQLLIERYQFTYISNLLSLFYTNPVTIASLFAGFIRNYRRRELSSQFGYVRGLRAPSEAGRLIDRWFGSDMTKINVSPEMEVIVRKSMLGLCEIMGGPFLFKNLKLGLKIECLNRLFPNSVFIDVRRNPVFMAQSILMVRRKLKASDNIWWSFPIPGMERLVDMDPFYQIAYQIKGIQDHIETEREKVGKERFITVSYEAICEQTDDVLAGIESRLLACGVGLEPKPYRQHRLTTREEVKLPQEEWDRLKTAIEEIVGPCA